MLTINSRLALTILISLHLWLPEAYGQIMEKQIPWSAIQNLESVSVFHSLSLSDSVREFRQAGVSKPQNITDQFAVPLEARLNPENSGEWANTPDGRVWRVGVVSVNAYSLYVTFRFRLSPGAKVYVYGPRYRGLRGALTHRNNSPSEILSVAPVAGDSLIVELNLPEGSTAELEILKVYHDFLDIYAHPIRQDPKNKNHKLCSEDINCANGRYWQTEKRSVCRIISNGGMGTGTLLGNTAGSNTPLLLTASHLISSEEIAASAIFLFNYETTTCGGEVNPEIQSLSGASLLASGGREVDFSLLALKEVPPPAYQTFYAGWDAHEEEPTSGVCIHHPFGGHKQISIEYQALADEDIGEGFEAGSTWKVRHWEIGYTGTGSSGAPLFDARHRVRGTLTGGRSNCSFPKDDYFTKLSAGWNSNPDSSKQLERWLDPEPSGQLVLHGYDPYGFNPDHCDTAWNLSSEELTSHIATGYSRFAERFIPAGDLQINGIFLHIARLGITNPLSYITLKIWHGDPYPGPEIYMQTVFLSDLQAGMVNHIPLDTVLTIGEPFFAGYSIPEDFPPDTFFVSHASGRSVGQPATLFLYDGIWQAASDPGAAGINTSLALGISSCYGNIRPPAPTELKVYPNPCLEVLHIDTPEKEVIRELRCYDLNGRNMPVTLKQNEAGYELRFDLAPGVYWLRIATNQHVYSNRFIVIED